LVVPWTREGWKEAFPDEPGGRAPPAYPASRRALNSYRRIIESIMRGGGPHQRLSINSR
jgi:hypothetical protein